MLNLLHLSESEEQELEKVLRTHPKAYMREKASALLQVSRGKRVVEVAQSGLLQKRRVPTVYDWIKRYKSSGLDGLLVKAGRGRKHSFFSSPRDPRGSAGISSSTSESFSDGLRY